VSQYIEVLASKSAHMESADIEDDYVIVTDGACYVDGVTAYANGTHVITVKKVSDPMREPASRVIAGGE